MKISERPEFKSKKPPGIVIGEVNSPILVFLISSFIFEERDASLIQPRFPLFLELLEILYSSTVFSNPFFFGKIISSLFRLC